MRRPCVEDLVIVIIIALVLLPALAPTGDPAGGGGTNLFLTLGLVAAFVVLMLVVGSRVFPWAIKRVKATESRGLFTLAVVAIALGVAFGSYKLFGVSFALGAFFAGMVVNASDSSHRAEKEMKPLEDVFAVLFFVSLGMLLDPRVFLDHPLRVLAVVGIIIVGKSLAALGIVLALGGKLRTGLTVSAALAQIGDFSFILAGLGTTTGLLPPEGQTLIVAGAIVSITLNPLVFSAVDRWGPGSRPEAAPAGGAKASAVID